MTITYEQAFPGEALKHNERLIRFISYIEPGNISFNDKFKDLVSAINEEIKSSFEDYDLEYVPYDDISDIILEIKPFYDIPTCDVVKKAEPYFKRFLELMKPYNTSSANMAYYIKYKLDRWLPEELVKKDSKTPLL